jgi:hypothetical protein
VNACIRATALKKFVSNTVLASSRSASSSGVAMYLPALLTKTSSFPLVLDKTTATAAAMEEEYVTSSSRHVMLEMEDRCESYLGDRAGRGEDVKLAREKERARDD